MYLKYLFKFSGAISDGKCLRKSGEKYTKKNTFTALFQIDREANNY